MLGKICLIGVILFMHCMSALAYQEEEYSKRDLRRIAQYQEQGVQFKRIAKKEYRVRRNWEDIDFYFSHKSSGGYLGMTYGNPKGIRLSDDLRKPRGKYVRLAKIKFFEQDAEVAVIRAAHLASESGADAVNGFYRKMIRGHVYKKNDSGDKRYEHFTVLGFWFVGELIRYGSSETDDIIADQKD